MKYAFSALLSLFLPLWMMAQNPDSTVAMADGMRSSGKIYVVVAVLCLILLGIALYLIRLDRKLTRLEKGLSTTNEH